MFDAGFLEMLLIGVIALLVVGPERLPGLARKAGALLGKAKAFVATTKSDIEKEIQADELRNMLIMQEEKIRDLQNSFKNTSDQIESGIRQEMQETETLITSEESASRTVTTDNPEEKSERKLEKKNDQQN